MIDLRAVISGSFLLMDCLADVLRIYLSVPSHVTHGGVCGGWEVFANDC